MEKEEEKKKGEEGRKRRERERSGVPRRARGGEPAMTDINIGFGTPLYTLVLSAGVWGCHKDDLSRLKGRRDLPASRGRGV